MQVIIRLALRNLKEHKSKSLIIGLFIIFGTAIVILGNSFLESVNRGLEKDFRANYTGDAVISCIPDQGIMIDIFGAQATSITGTLPQIPALPEMEKIQEIVNHTEGIKSQTKLISAQILMLHGEDEIDMDDILDNESLELTDIPVAMLFAGPEDNYFEVFPGQHITEGSYPKSGTNEILVDERLRRGFEKTYKKSLNVGDKVLCVGANTKGIIREAFIAGFFNPANENSAMFQNIYCNPSFARSFADLTYASGFTDELPDSVDFDIANLSEDELFGSDDDFFSFDSDDSFLASEDFDFNSILGDTSLRDELNKTDDGSWHFIIMKTTTPSKANEVVDYLNQQFEEQGIHAQAMNWKKAALSYTMTVEGIGIIFNILIIILAVVVFIIIMNTMTVSVIERTGEIGTIRAIGGEKKFVRKLFFAESFIITVSSAIIGTIVAVIISLIFNSLNITITNEIAKMILGGGMLHFSLTPAIIILTIVIATLGSILSNIYPVTSALRITPLKALSKGSE